MNVERNERRRYCCWSGQQQRLWPACRSFQLWGCCLCVPLCEMYMKDGDVQRRGEEGKTRQDGNEGSGRICLRTVALSVKGKSAEKTDSTASVL